VIVELWPIAPSQPSKGPDQEDTESHWHFGERTEAGHRASP
jgi:hypothetical protein